jgi:deoxynucleoside triphosphate triphosphohydrolase SAMHD1
MSDDDLKLASEELNAIAASGRGPVFNDSVYGHVELHAISKVVMDTPQFQRLRDITQLGGVYYVFPAAASRRFEHSIGVAHLAQMLIRRIRTKQPELQITIQDELCVELAGLVHDLGHGPFSHLFDATVLPALGAVNFHHEHASVNLFDLLIEENQLEPEFQRYGLEAHHRHFIKELVLGSKKEADDVPGFKWVGQPPEKMFLYDIVANKRNGVDVDKLDYFARDCHMLHLSCSFDSQRLMRNSRVISVVRDGLEATEICFNHKSAFDLYDFFHTRHSLYKRAYFHKVSSAVDIMVGEALILANDHFTVPGKDGVPTKMSDSYRDMHAYWRITEWIVKYIQHSTIPELEPSRDLLNRLWKRDLFVCAGEILLDMEQTDIASLKAPAIVAQLQKLKKAIPSCNSLEEAEAEVKAMKVLGDNDIFVTMFKLGYGMKGKNPVSDCTTFFIPSKDGSGAVEVGHVGQDSVSRLIPKEYEEKYVRVFARHKSQVPALKRLFSRWCSHKNRTSLATSQISPMKGAVAGTLCIDSDKSLPFDVEA